eukprot:1148873-Pelagomonas_calceolata.AAC.4
MQASGVQAVCFCGFALARHNVIHSSLRTLEDRGDSGRAPKQLQHKQQPSKETQQIEPKTQYHNEHEEQEELGWNNGGDANVQQRSSTTPHLQTRINAEPALAAVAAPLSASSVAGANGGFVGIDAASNTSLRSESSSQAWQQQQQQQQQQHANSNDRSYTLDKQQRSIGTRSSGISTRSRTFQTLNLSGYANPAVQRALLEASRARARISSEQSYSSKLEQPASHASRTLESLQAACRVCALRLLNGMLCGYSTAEFMGM